MMFGSRTMVVSHPGQPKLMPTTGSFQVVGGYNMAPAMPTLLKTLVAAPLANQPSKPAVNCPCLTSADSIETVLQAMAAYPQHLSVQRDGCSIIGKMAEDPAQQAQITANDGINIVLTAMEQRAGDEIMQCKGCAAVASLATNSPSNKAIVARLGGVDVVIKAMERHGGSAQVQVAACLALRILAPNESRQEKFSVTEALLNNINSLGGIGFIIRAMTVHDSVEAVQNNGAWALCNLACSSRKNQGEITDNGGIEAILKALTLHKSADVQQHCCQALRNVIANNPDSQARFAASGGKEQVDSLVAYGSNALVRKAAQAVLAQSVVTGRPRGNTW